MEKPSEQARRLGQRIVRAREERGWDKSQLARKAGVHPSYIGRLETGAYDRPSVTKMTQIAGALGVRVSDLVDVPQALPEDLVEQLRALVGADDTALRQVFARLRELPPEERASALRWTVQAFDLWRSAPRRD